MKVDFFLNLIANSRIFMFRFLKRPPMKKTLLLSGLLILLVACKKEAKAEAPKVVTIKEPVLHECYSGALNKDTVALSIFRQGSQVTTGQLQYRFFEKDKSAGTVVGQIKGDTLFAAYSFSSEGSNSTREVAFLKKGDSYVEGYGEVKDDGHGNVTFKDTKQLHFDGKMTLLKVECQ
jgi:hypothetical protein